MRSIKLNETGLNRLRLARHLRACDHPVPPWNQIHRRHFLHLVCEEEPAERWRHHERHADDGNPPFLFEFFWAAFPGGVPELAPGHGRMLPALMGQQE